MEDALDVVRVLCKHIKMSNKTRDSIKKYADAAAAAAVDEVASDEDGGEDVREKHKESETPSTFKKPKQDCVTR